MLAYAPPTPWEPRTRGGILLPSREEVKEEEEEGGLSPPCFRWRQNAARGHHHTNTSIIFTNISITFLPSMQRFNPSFTCCNLYLNMVLNAIYYFPMMYGYPMMFE